MTRKTHGHVIGLDLLRVAAAVLVVVYHFGFWNWTTRQPLAIAFPGQAPSWGRSLHFGWIGVEIFFVISGYVIAFSSANIPSSVFARSRALRLAPTSWIGATIVLGVWLTDGMHKAPAVLLAYIKTLAFWPLDAIDGVWWTLGIEIDFYLLVYLLIRWNRIVAFEAIMGGIGLASGLFWMLALSLQMGLAGQTGALGLLRTLVLRAEANRELQLLLVQHGCFFALGTMLCKIAPAGLTRRRALMMTGLVVACLLEILGQNGIICRASQSDLSVWPALIAWAVAMGMFGLAIAFNAHLLRMGDRVTGLIRFAGLATYPLYLVHNAVGIGASFVLAPLIGPAAVSVGLVIAVLAAFVIAGQAEPRLRAILLSWWPKHASAIPAPTVLGHGSIGGRKERLI